MVGSGKGETEHAAQKFMRPDVEAGGEEEGKEKGTLRVMRLRGDQVLNQGVQTPSHQYPARVDQRLEIRSEIS